MASIKNIKADQILWSVMSTRMGNTRMTRRACYPCRVISVHDDHAMISWNYNPARRYTPKQIAKLLVNKPKMKDSR